MTTSDKPPIPSSFSFEAGTWWRAVVVTVVGLACAGSILASQMEPRFLLRCLGYHASDVLLSAVFVGVFLGAFTRLYDEERRQQVSGIDCWAGLGITIWMARVSQVLPGSGLIGVGILMILLLVVDCMCAIATYRIVWPRTIPHRFKTFCFVADLLGILVVVFFNVCSAIDVVIHPPV